MGLSSSLFGNINSGESFDFLCPNNSYVIRFSGRAGAFMDAIAATCSDGSTMGPFGGSGGIAQWSETCPGGFSGIKVESDSQQIVAIKVICNGREQGIIGWGGGVSHEFTCSGQVLKGLRGTAAVLVYSLQFFCSGKQQLMMFENDTRQ